MNDVTLREHIETQIKWIDRYFERRVADIHIAVEKAYEQMDTRLSGMNEFRDTLTDQAAQFLTKSEADALWRDIDRRLKELEVNRAKLEGKSLVISGIVALFASGAVFVLSRMIG